MKKFKEVESICGDDTDMDMDLNVDMDVGFDVNIDLNKERELINISMARYVSKSKTFPPHCAVFIRM